MGTTIYDVAKKAGVSISTVSRVLNNNPNVLHETRQRVLKTITDLNFRPNPIARGLVVKQTSILEVFFSLPGYLLNFQDSWYNSLLAGISEVARENKYGLLINTMAGSYDLHDAYEKAFYNIVDGVIMVAPVLDDRTIGHILGERLPVVCACRRTEDPRIDFVDTDNLGGALAVVNHFAALGHKRIATLTGPLDLSTNARDRFQGFREGMERHKFPLPEDYILAGDFREESGAQALDKLMDLKEPPTAVFCANDTMALGFLRAVVKSGMKPGKDIAVAGYDNIREAAFPEFSLTTVEARTPEIGKQAAMLMLQKVRHHNRNWTSQHLTIPTELVVRGSCGAKK